MSLRLRIALLILVSVAGIGGYWWYAGPTPQPLAYHKFADQRPLAGVPNALNVLSNLPFIVVGVMGIAFMSHPQSRRGGVFQMEFERTPYWIYFIGLVLTGIGSSYYHATPNNETLTWDRAGLAITFMALFTSILAERVHVACARWALWPLVVLGVGSVFYWDYTERVGAGDLRLYFIVQFFPLFVLPILLCYPARYTHGGNLLASLLCYVVAKAVEILDRQIYTGAGFVSGHTLKHLVAGVSAGLILLMLWQRQTRSQPAPELAPAPATAG